MEIKFNDILQRANLNSIQEFFMCGCETDEPPSKKRMKKD